MSSHGHNKTVCCSCNCIIRQCRCMAKDKVVSYDMCKRCTDELVKQEIERKESEDKPYRTQGMVYYVPLSIFGAYSGSLIVAKYTDLINYYDRVINPEPDNKHYIGPIIHIFNKDRKIGFHDSMLKVAGYYFDIRRISVEELPEESRDILFKSGYVYLNKEWKPNSTQIIDFYLIKEL